jgi:hypothetical protein
MSTHEGGKIGRTEAFLREERDELICCVCLDWNFGCGSSDDQLVIDRKGCLFEVL